MGTWTKKATIYCLNNISKKYVWYLMTLPQMNWISLISNIEHILLISLLKSTFIF